MRQLVEHLPVMVTPKRASTRTQPIAVDGAARYHAGVLTLPEASRRVPGIGGPVLQQVMVLRRGGAHPAAQPRLAAPQLALVTDVGTATGCALVASMTNEVVVRDHSIRELLPLDPMRKGEGRAEGLGERAQAQLRR